MNLPAVQVGDPHVAAHNDEREVLNELSVVAPVEGLPAYVYGASYEAVDLENTGPSTRYINQVFRKLGITAQNRAFSGDETTDMFFHMQQPNSTRRFTMGSKGLVWLTGCWNDALRADWASAERERGFKANLEAAIWRFFSMAGFDSDSPSLTQTGWSDLTAPISGSWEGANMEFKRTTSSTSTLSAPVNGTDFVVFSVQQASGSFPNPGAPLVVKVDGVTVATSVPGFVKASLTGAAFNVGALAIPLLNLSPGEKVISVTTPGATSDNPAYLLEITAIDKTSLPQIVIPKFMDLGSGYPSGMIPKYQGFIDDVIENIVDQAPWAASALSTYTHGEGFWSPATGLGNDGLHANDRGEGALANAALAHLRGLPYREGMNRL